MIIAFVLLAAVEAPPTFVTLDQLRSQPAGFREKRVTVAGQIDECWNMSCNLCPIEATPASPHWERCLAISFDKFRGGLHNVGADVDGAFRYADVVITARFDPTCLEGLCTDRGSVLLAARVEEVKRRRRSRDGLIKRPDPLIEASAEAARPLIALMRPQQGQSEPRQAVKVFATRSDPKLQRNAVVCRASSRPGTSVAWPTSWNAAIVAPSTEDRFGCSTAFKDQRGWVLEPR